MSSTNGSEGVAQRRLGTVLLSLVLLCLSLLAWRVVFIRKAYGASLTAMARRQQHGAAAIPARRGMIFDVHGRVVAVTRAAPDVFVDPSLVDDVDALAADLAPRLDRPAGELAEMIRRRPLSRYVVVARRVDAVAAEAIRALGRRSVGLSESFQRSYPLGASMGHVLGWVGRDGRGLGGVELKFDTHLRGREGRSTTIHDAHRRAFRRGDTPSVHPVDGGHLVLTLDAEIQRIAERALQRSLDEFNAPSGVVIVMVPSTGEILGLACGPAFNPADPVTAESLPLRRNRAVTDPVEPGSTFKPIIASGALDGGFVSTTEMIDCHNGSHRFGPRTLTDSRPHGMMDLRGIIMHSSNIGMGIIATRMGNRVLYETLRRFGFGDRAGLEFPGESGGVVYALDKWDRYSTTSIPIGYEVLVTPLQLLSAFAAIINDGLLVKPRLVKMLLAPDGTVLQSFEGPEVVRRAVSIASARYITHELLTAVVEEGGGGRAAIGPYRVLGKTGTAKLLYAQGGGYEPGAYLGLFVGAAPASAPEIVAMAMIRRPDPAIGYYGGRVAAPVVGEILADVLEYLRVPPDQPSSENAL